MTTAGGPASPRPLAVLIGVPAGDVCGPDGCAAVVVPTDVEDSPDDHDDAAEPPGRSVHPTA